MNFKFYTTFLFIWLVMTAHNDTPKKVTVSEVLSGQLASNELIGNGDAVLNHLNGSDYGLPLLKELGFRYGTDELTNAKGQVAASVSFNSLKLRKKQRDLKKSLVNIYQAKREMTTSEVMQERYAAVTEIYFTEVITEGKEKLDSLLIKKNNLLRAGLQYGADIKVKELVNVEEGRRAVQLSLKSLANNKKCTYKILKEHIQVNTPFQITFNDFISVEKIKEQLKKQNRKTDYTPELKLKESKIDLAKAELEVEEADFKQYLKNVQLVYEKSNNAEFAEEFSFRVGVNIPIKGNLNPKKNQLILEMKDAESDFFNTQNQNQKDKKIKITEIENLIEQYELHQTFIQSSVTNRILNDPSIMSSLEPTDIIDLHINRQKKKNEVNEIYHEIVRQYLELLDLTGALATNVSKNYLSN